MVLPHEIDVLQTDPDRDLVTLITCTPYAINSHRLLVRGTRIPYIPGMADGIQVILPVLNTRMLILLAFSLMFLLGLIVYRAKQRRQRQYYDND